MSIQLVLLSHKYPLQKAGVVAVEERPSEKIEEQTQPVQMHKNLSTELVLEAVGHFGSVSDLLCTGHSSCLVITHLLKSPPTSFPRYFKNPAR